MENIERLNDVRNKSFFEVHFRVGEETLSVNWCEMTAGFSENSMGKSPSKISHVL